MVLQLANLSVDPTETPPGDIPPGGWIALLRKWLTPSPPATADRHLCLFLPREWGAWTGPDAAPSGGQPSAGVGGKRLTLCCSWLSQPTYAMQVLAAVAAVDPDIQVELHLRPAPGDDDPLTLPPAQGSLGGLAAMHRGPITVILDDRPRPQPGPPPPCSTGSPPVRTS